jgi:flagellar biosynthetic protein FliR
MPAEAAAGLLPGAPFLLVLARMSALAGLIPLPGLRHGPAVPRVLLALSLTAALRPVWPEMPERIPAGRMLVSLLIEASIGVAIGLAVVFATEAFVLAAQAIALQAGYSYASTIDPSSEADSGVLPVAAQLIAALMLLGTGLDRMVVRALARSLEVWPPGSGAWPEHWSRLAELGGAMFELALRLAMPVFTLLLLTDLAIGLLGRVQAQMQLLSLGFPLKMLASLVLLALLVSDWPALFESAWRANLRAVFGALAGGVR